MAVKTQEKSFEILNYCEEQKVSAFPSLLHLLLCNYLTLKFSFHCSTVKPIAVHITTREKFVSAEKRYDVECKSSGSRPEAVLTWWKGSRQIKRMAKNVSIYTSLKQKCYSFHRCCCRFFFFLFIFVAMKFSKRKENVCCNFNDVYLMMPELMSQQTIMVKRRQQANFHVSMQMMMRGQIPRFNQKPQLQKFRTADWSAS